MDCTWLWEVGSHPQATSAALMHVHTHIGGNPTRMAHSSSALNKVVDHRWDIQSVQKDLLQAVCEPNGGGRSRTQLATASNVDGHRCVTVAKVCPCLWCVCAFMHMCNESSKCPTQDSAGDNRSTGHGKVHGNGDKGRAQWDHISPAYFKPSWLTDMIRTGLGYLDYTFSFRMSHKWEVSRQSKGKNVAQPTTFSRSLLKMVGRWNLRMRHTLSSR